MGLNYEVQSKYQIRIKKIQIFQSKIVRLITIDPHTMSQTNPYLLICIRPLQNEWQKYTTKNSTTTQIHLLKNVF